MVNQNEVFCHVEWFLILGNFSFVPTSIHPSTQTFDINQQIAN
jgi:hypothetical protein